MNRTIHHAVIASVSCAAALTLVACGGTDTTSNSPDTTASTSMPGMSSPSAETASEHTTADVSFATTMIPHHQQAVTMSQMAQTQASDARVTTLAAAIQAAQDPEIETMSGWLAAWGQPVPSASEGHNMSGMGGFEMEGMMSAEEMSQLTGATGPAFDRMWLQMMIKHHEGAVIMSTIELRDGQNPAARALAQQIITAQNTEIDTMEQMLPTISG